MKKLILLCAAFYFCGFTYSQTEEHIPDHVEDHLSDNFPHTEELDVDWDVEDDGFFSANFEHNDLEWEVIYNTEGDWHATEMEIPYEKLPQAVRTKIEKDFGDYDVLLAEDHHRADDSDVYEVELEGGNHILEIEFSADGHILKRYIEVEDAEEEMDKEEESKHKH